VAITCPQSVQLELIGKAWRRSHPPCTGWTGNGDGQIYEASPDLAGSTGGVLSLEHTALDVLDRLGIPQQQYVSFAYETAGSGSASPGSARPSAGSSTRT
jgi:hypothetical protein